MAQTWLEISEITAGLVISKRLSVHSVDSEKLHPPYNDIVKGFKTGKGLGELMIQFNPEYIQTALAANEAINGLGDKLEWGKLVSDAYQSEGLATQLIEVAKKLRKGEDVKPVARQLINTMLLGDNSGFTPLSEIETEEVPFIETGWPIFDRELVGLPKHGLCILGGTPGSGKSWVATRLAQSFAAKHTDKRVGVFSLEMLKSEIAGRFRFGEKMANSPIPKDVESRIHVNEDIATVNEIISRSSQMDDLGMLIIDFADLAIRGGGDEAKYGQMYIDLSNAAKSIFRCPVIVLSQLSRVATTDIPRPNHLRWSGLAEAMGWSILMTYNPDSSYLPISNTILPFVKGAAYLICWKMRGGFRMHPKDSPGAIEIKYRGDRGWHPTQGRWIPIKETGKKSNQSLNYEE